MAGRPQRSKRRKSLAERAKQPELSPEEAAEAKRRMCTSKTRYALKGEAERIARERGIGFYNCQVCGGWHLTSRPPDPA